MDDPGARRRRGREDGAKKQPKVERCSFLESKKNLLFAGHYSMSKGEGDFTVFPPGRPLADKTEPLASSTYLVFVSTLISVYFAK